MWPCGPVGRLGAWPGRKVSLSGHPESSPALPPHWPPPRLGPLQGLPEHSSPFSPPGLRPQSLAGLWFSRSGRNTGSVFWGQAPSVSLCRALPWKGSHKGGVCELRREAGSRPQMSLPRLLLWLPVYAWAAWPTRRPGVLRGQPPSPRALLTAFSQCRARRPAAVPYEVAHGPFAIGFGCF